MKIHHLNCGSMCPMIGALTKSVISPELICHCLLVESRSKLILIDTGIGQREIANPERLGPIGKILGVQFGHKHTAVAQVKSSGFSPSDVTDIIVTHLDMDHAGGIPDFKNARVHVSAAELGDAEEPSTARAKIRYRSIDFLHDTEWVTYRPQRGTRWKGFDCVRDLKGLPPEILLVNLPGHTAGHFGVAIEHKNRWLLHAGDAYYDRRGLQTKAEPPLALKLLLKTLHNDYDRALKTMRRLRKISIERDIRLFCSHDPKEFNSLLD